MTQIIAKRLSLHKELAKQQRQNSDLQHQLNHLQSLAGIGSAAYMIAHEINNLLTPMANYADLALENPEDKLLTQKALNKAMKNCRRASRIMESILALANGHKQDKKNVPLKTLIEEVFTCLCRDFKKDGITVNLMVPDSLTISAVPVQIQQVFMNLILNARDAMLPAGGMLTITARENADDVQIEFTDTGCGINPANLKKIFEPFFSDKTGGKARSKQSGSGLGLAFCKKIIDAHNGAISVKSEMQKGTAFKITLPKPKKGKS